MKKAFKWGCGTFCILLCIAMIWGCVSAVHTYQERSEALQEYLDTMHTEATELPLSQSIEIQRINYTEWYNTPLTFNSEPTAYFQRAGHLYYVFEDAPDFLLHIWYDRWIREELLIKITAQLPSPQTTTAEKVMIFSEEFPEVPEYGAFPQTDALRAMSLQHEEIDELQNRCFDESSAESVCTPAKDRELVSVLPEDWEYDSDGSPKYLHLHWQFRENPYFWENQGVLLKNKDGKLYLCLTIDFSESMGWWAWNIRPIPEPLQSALQEALKDTNL